MFPLYLVTRIFDRNAGPLVPIARRARDLRTRDIRDLDLDRKRLLLLRLIRRFVEVRRTLLNLPRLRSTILRLEER